MPPRVPVPRADPTPHLLATSGEITSMTQPAATDIYHEANVLAFARDHTDRHTEPDTRLQMHRKCCIVHSGSAKPVANHHIIYQQRFIAQVALCRPESHTLLGGPFFNCSPKPIDH